MNIIQLHDAQKVVSAKSLFKTSEGQVSALQIHKDALLSEHITKVPALLVCISGEVIYENENDMKQTLLSGDYINIEPLVKHWVHGVENSQLLLIK